MMKPSICYLIFLLFTLTFTLQIIFTTVAAADDFVYDIAGKKIRKDTLYSIGPVIWAKGGGVKLSDTENNKKVCPFNVVQDPSETIQGGSFFFVPTLYKEKYVRLEYNLGVDSGVPTSTKCDKSTFWKIEDPDTKAPLNFITTGGIFEEDVSCFQVVKYPKPTNPKVRSYMLQHCPFYCGGAQPLICYNVSISVHKGVRHLASSGTPFEFVFNKASKSQTLRGSL